MTRARTAAMVLLALSMPPCTQAREPRLAFWLTGPARVEASAPLRLQWHLRNDGPTAVAVLSHVETGDDRHFDDITLVLRRDPARDPSAWVQEISLQGPRKAAAPVHCALLPGRTLSHGFELSRWLPAGVTLTAGTYLVAARLAAPASAPALLAPCDAATAQAVPAAMWRGPLDSPAIRIERR